MELMSYFRSSCSYRVRIGLNLKGLEYKVVPIHLLKDGGEQFQSRLTALNPSQKVPVLVDKDQGLAQSIAIFEYLEEVYPETALYPKDTLAKAKMRQMLEVINSDIQPLQNLRVLIHLKKNYKFSDDDKENWIRHWINNGFQALEELLFKNGADSTPFSFGDKPSALECFIVPQVYNAVRFKMDMSQYPTLEKINNNCLPLPAFVKAHPDNQPDSPS